MREQATMRRETDAGLPSWRRGHAVAASASGGLMRGSGRRRVDRLLVLHGVLQQGHIADRASLACGKGRAVDAAACPAVDVATVVGVEKRGALGIETKLQAAGTVPQPIREAAGVVEHERT